MKRIAVLMTCFNRVKTTLACLERLFVQELPDDYAIEVFLVDDASPDNTGQLVKARYPLVNVIAGKGGLFWCKGMRLAWDSAVTDGDYDFFLWLNDDVMLKEGALLHMLADHEEVQSVVVGTFATDESESDISYGVTKQMPDGQHPRPSEIVGLYGNLVLVPRGVYKKVGPICGEFHHQYGDWDYAALLRKNGLRYYASSHFCGVCPQQPERYFHLKGKSLVQRLRLLTNPKGFCVHDAFLFRKRHRGFLRACVSAVHVFCVVVFALERK